MAQFYRTASAAPLDYMYELNLPLMEKVINVNDRYITENLNQLGGLEDVVTKFPYLEADTKRAKEIADAYGSNIDSIAKAIRDDPANWRRKLEPIRDLSRKLRQDYTTGEISKIMGNYSTYKQVADSIDKQVEQFGKTGKGISADRARAYKEYYLSQFSKANPAGTAYDPQTGNYNVMRANTPMANMDIKKTLAEGIDKMKASGTDVKWDEQNGMYLKKTTRGWEGITPEEVLQAMGSNVTPQLMQYLREDSNVGLIEGVYDDKGQFIEPYSYTPSPATKEELAEIAKKQNQINSLRKTRPEEAAALQNDLDQFKTNLNGRTKFGWNNDSYLSKVMQGIVAEGAWSKSRQFDEIRPDQVKVNYFNQGQQTARNNANIASREKVAEMLEKGRNDRAAKILELNWWKAMNPPAKGTTKTGTGTKSAADAKKENQPTESTISKLGTNSFEGWMTTDKDGNPIHVLSNEGLSSEIDKTKGSIEQAGKRKVEINNAIHGLTTALGRTYAELPPHQQAQIDALTNEFAQIERDLPKLNDELNMRRKWYEGSVNAALSNDIAALKDGTSDALEALTPKEIELYKKYENDRQGKAQLEKTKKTAQEAGYVFQDANTGAYSNSFTKWLSGFGASDESSDKNREARSEYTEYLKVKDKVDKRRDIFLSNIRRDYISSDAIQVGQKDNDDLAQMIFSQTQGLKMYDKIGQPSDNITLEGKGVSWFSPRADNYKATFEGTGKNIVDYMAKHKTNVVIEQVGYGTGMGTGNAVVKMTFNDKNGEIPQTPFYVELTPELQKQIGNKFINSKDPGIKKLATDLLDDESNELRKQMIFPSMPRTTGRLNTTDPVSKVIYINNGNQKIPVTLTRFASSDGSDNITLQARNQNGELVPFDLPGNEGHRGWYKSPEHFIDLYKKLKAGPQTPNP